MLEKRESGTFTTYPLSHQRRSHNQRTNVIWRAFGREHKGNGSPAERVEDDKEVDADDGEDGVAIELAGGRVHCLVDADVKHGERLACRANEEGPL